MNVCRWALVKDAEVAQKMVKFVELNTIGVSKDSQLRAAKIMKAVCDGYELSPTREENRLFHFAQRKMAERWSRLRAAVAASGIFSLPDEFSGYCTFAKDIVAANPRKNITLQNFYFAPNNIAIVKYYFGILFLP
jgi:L-tryptophan--pyruvate aminotransferase